MNSSKKGEYLRATDFFDGLQYWLYFRKFKWNTNTEVWLYQKINETEFWETLNCKLNLFKIEDGLGQVVSEWHLLFQPHQKTLNIISHSDKIKQMFDGKEPLPSRGP